MNKYDKQSLRDNIGTYTGSLTGPILDLIDWGIVRRNNRGLRVVAVVKGVHRVNQPRDIGAKRLIAKDWDEGLIWTDDIITVDNNGSYMVISKNMRQPLVHNLIHGSRRHEHLDAGTALALDADDIDRIDPAGRSRREGLQSYPVSPRPGTDAAGSWAATQPRTQTPQHAASTRKPQQSSFSLSSFPR